MATVSKVIDISVNHDRAAQDAVASSQGDLLVCDVHSSKAGSVGGYISQIAGMSDFVGWATVFHCVWVEVRTSAHASVCSVAKFVDVETMEAGFQAFNRAGHLNGIRFRLKANTFVSYASHQEVAR